jgi:hypothetical protein
VSDEKIANAAVRPFVGTNNMFWSCPTTIGKIMKLRQIALSYLFKGTI